MAAQRYTRTDMSLSARPAPAGPPPGASVPPRVLLDHATPLQRVTPVPAYGLERLRTAAERAGAQVEIVDPYLVSEDPYGAARAAAERLRPDVIGLGVRIVDDCIVVDRLDAPADEPTDITFLLPDVRELRRALGAGAPEAVFVAGGAGFSACPQECLDYLELEWGVVGAGEEALAAICRGEPLDQIPGLVRHGRDGGIDAYHLAFAAATRRERLDGADDPSFLEPVVYSRPWPPRELARRLDEAFADLPHVNRVGVAYRSGTTALAEAYRTVLSNNGKESWASLLERAAAASDMQRSGAEPLAACVQIAVWHNRFDLAATAVARLLREDVPPEMSRRQLRLARLAYGGLAVVDRARGVRLRRRT